MATSVFRSIVPPTQTRPKPAFLKDEAQVLVRDNFTITTWLSIGAAVQGTLILLTGRLALLPAVVLILYKLADTVAQTVGLRRNPHMDGVLMKKFSAQVPDEQGNFGSTPSNAGLVVFHIGARCNHPLGILAPGLKELGDHFVRMAADLEDRAEEFGFLGQTSWTNSSDRKANNETMQVQYFRSVEDLHRYAHSSLHREAWNWWNKHVKQYPHLSIYHETFNSPKGNWETIYMNSHVSHLAAARFPVTNEKTGVKAWASPVVEIQGAKLPTMLGRMNKTDEVQKGHEGV